MKIGYIRVSTTEQNLEAQKSAVLSAGAEKVFEEKVSGRSMNNRQELQKLLSMLREGDEVIIKKLCRLGRSVPDLHKIAAQIKEAGASLNVLDQKIDTGTPTGQLLFNVLGSLAEFERSLIAERMAEGKKATGKYGGRPKSTTEKQDKTIYSLWQRGAGLNQLAESYKCSKMTIWRKVNKIRKEKEKSQEAAF